MRLLGVAMLSLGVAVLVAIVMSLIPQVFEALVADLSSEKEEQIDQLLSEMTAKLNATKAGVTQEIEQSRKYFYDFLSAVDNKTATWHDESKSVLLSLHDRGLSMNESLMNVGALLSMKTTLVERNAVVFKSVKIQRTLAKERNYQLVSKAEVIGQLAMQMNMAVSTCRAKGDLVEVYRQKVDHCELREEAALQQLQVVDSQYNDFKRKMIVNLETVYSKLVPADIAPAQCTDCLCRSEESPMLLIAFALIAGLVLGSVIITYLLQVSIGKGDLYYWRRPLPPFPFSDMGMEEKEADEEKGSLEVVEEAGVDADVSLATDMVMVNTTDSHSQTDTQLTSCREIEALRNEVAHAVKERNDSRLELDQLTSLTRAATAKYDADIADLHAKIQRLQTTERENTKHARVVTDLEEQVAALQSALNRQITDGRHLSNSAKDELLMQADALKTQIAVAEKAQARLTDSKKEVFQLKEQITSLIAVYEEERTTRYAAEERANVLETAIRAAETEKTSATRVHAATTEKLDAAHKKLLETESSAQTLQSQLEESRQKSKASQEEISRLQTKMRADEQQITHLSQCVESLSKQVTDSEVQLKMTKESAVTASAELAVQIVATTALEERLTAAGVDSATIEVELQLTKDCVARAEEQAASYKEAAVATIAELEAQIAELSSAATSAASEKSRLRIELEDQMDRYQAMSAQLEYAITQKKEGMTAIKKQALQELRSYEEVLRASLADVAEFMSPRTTQRKSQHRRVRHSDDEDTEDADNDNTNTDAFANSARLLAEYSGRFEYWDIFGGDNDSQQIHYTDNSIIIVQAEEHGGTESSRSTDNTHTDNNRIDQYNNHCTDRSPVSMQFEYGGEGTDLSDTSITSSIGSVTLKSLAAATGPRSSTSAYGSRVSPTRERHDTIQSISESISEIGAFGTALRHRITELEEAIVDKDDEVRRLRCELLFKNDEHSNTSRELAETDGVVSSPQELGTPLEYSVRDPPQSWASTGSNLDSNSNSNSNSNSSSSSSSHRVAGFTSPMFSPIGASVVYAATGKSKVGQPRDKEGEYDMSKRNGRGGIDGSPSDKENSGPPNGETANNCSSSPRQNTSSTFLRSSVNCSLDDHFADPCPSLAENSAFIPSSYLQPHQRHSSPSRDKSAAAAAATTPTPTGSAKANTNTNTNSAKNSNDNTNSSNNNDDNTNNTDSAATVADSSSSHRNSLSRRAAQEESRRAAQDKLFLETFRRSMSLRAGASTAEALAGVVLGKSLPSSDTPASHSTSSESPLGTDPMPDP